MKNLNKRIKNLDVLDITLTKLAVASFVIVILKLFPILSGWLAERSIWWFVAVWILFSIRPFSKFWKKI